MKLRLSLLLVLMIFNYFASAQKPRVTDLLCEYRVNPIGIDEIAPRLSWKLETTKRNTAQTAYEIRVGTNASVTEGRNILWSTGKVISDQSVHVTYAGPALISRQRYVWQVRIWDNNGKASSWSSPGYWEMGLLEKPDWTAQWIHPESDNPEAEVRPSPLLRKSFAINKPVKSARLYITSHGLYESHLNGKRVGDAVLTPGWTSYNKRLQYQVYDVTALLRQGENTAGVILADGWYRGQLGFRNQRNTYGKEVALLFQLELTYVDGSNDMIISDDSWRSSVGPLQMAEIYHGETYDARLEKAGWNLNGFNDGGWLGVRATPLSKEILVATVNEPIRKHEIFKPVRIFKTPKGETVVDFGQNLVGWVRFRAKGQRGQTITIRHAEVLDKEGNFYTANLRVAKATITYALKGDEPESYEPRFTFMGFRYANIEGYPGPLTADDVEAVTLYSDMTPTGTFECSDPLVNQLQHNIQWGQKGNFLDVPTDCPQRDERLGWTGDAQVFSRTATFNMNVAAFFTKWLKDLAADQVGDGRVPFVIPNVLGENASASAGWADAATIIPWNMYLAYGDSRILANQYHSMKSWVDYMARAMNKDNLWNTGFHFGDWLFYRPFDDNDGRSAVTDKYLIAQSFFIYSTKLVIRTAGVLGKKDDVEHYTALLKKISDAYINEYITRSGRLVSGTQTAYVLALQFDLLPESQRQAAAERLVKNIEQYGNHLTTGFLGTPYLCHVLTRYGYTDVAYTLLFQDTYPSWLYPVKMGATTIWERWDGIKPDSTFQTPGMNSFNHYAYGAIGDWMYRTIAGIDTDESHPGYKQIRISPEPGGRLTYAKAELKSLYGPIISAWKIESGIMKVDITIPPNSRAAVTLPNGAGQSISEGSTDINKIKELSDLRSDQDDVVFSLGSGSYHFEYQWTEPPK
jgi:alpha-L-rhamnosidase